MMKGSSRQDAESAKGSVRQILVAGFNPKVLAFLCELCGFARYILPLVRRYSFAADLGIRDRDHEEFFLNPEP
jgi:hypothetical protein